MKDPSKEADFKEELEKEIEEKPEELPLEEEEAMETGEELEKIEDETEEELPIEETEAEDELEETEEVVEEEIEEPIEEEIVEEEAVEEPTEEEKAEEERPARREREEIEEEIVEERIYTIQLGRAWISPPKKRAPRAIRIIRGFITRHMKIKTEAVEEEAERLVISNEVNEKIWSSGIKNPPRKIRVRAVKDKEGTVTLRLAEGD
jgi:large subunit ribosomal protein L31e